MKLVTVFFRQGIRTTDSELRGPAADRSAVHGRRCEHSESCLICRWDLSSLDDPIAGVLFEHPSVERARVTADGRWLVGWGPSGQVLWHNRVNDLIKAAEPRVNDRLSKSDLVELGISDPLSPRIGDPVDE